MSMFINHESVQGKFEVIDSFAIPRRKEFYLIGLITEGLIQEGWHAHIPLNGSLTLAVKIERVEYVLKAQQEYPVLVIAAQDEELDLLLSLSVGSEQVIISTEGAE
ncbi:hypothetical protein HMJ29_05245 [Hymenobacter taeanensis]|uniref:Uncharacterized protein n=1 Tax=Hymenobacter taeanensis TaxID=2735321 RepID=A0A6M6BD06_9BACT|nr:MULTISPECIES: hypothetical protein [Hymenobacter]QJX46371.1 hypothetical protein HMJ29_05245 [Hymenobacter taeanensis]UOQ80234.1 hypothetical protein MUN83_15560 [Hymenobacter sp. 5414T-23]